MKSTQETNKRLQSKRTKNQKKIMLKLMKVMKIMNLKRRTVTMKRLRMKQLRKISPLRKKKMR